MVISFRPDLKSISPTFLFTLGAYNVHHQKPSKPTRARIHLLAHRQRQPPRTLSSSIEARGPPRIYPPLVKPIDALS